MLDMVGIFAWYFCFWRLLCLWKKCGKSLCVCFARGNQIGKKNRNTAMTCSLCSVKSFCMKQDTIRIGSLFMSVDTCCAQATPECMFPVSWRLLYLLQANSLKKYESTPGFEPGTFRLEVWRATIAPRRRSQLEFGITDPNFRLRE